MSEPVLIEVIGERYGAIPEVRANKVDPRGVAHGQPFGATDRRLGIKVTRSGDGMATIVERIWN